MGWDEDGCSVNGELVVKLRSCMRFCDRKNEQLVDDGSEERKKE